MIRFILTMLVLFLIPLSVFSQLSVHYYDPPVKLSQNFGDVWGQDYIVSNTEPLGNPSGVVRPTDTILIAIPDTNIIPGAGLVIIKSSNNGMNWSAVASVSPAIVISKTRMVRSGLDSVYCVFQYGSALYILKVNYPFNGSQLRQLLNGGYRDFDCWSSSTGGLYLFVDSLGSNNIPRYASTDGGISWSQRGLVTSTAANPFVIKSGSGDTAILMYYQNPAAGDTTALSITVARYRESAPGQLSSVAFLTSLIPAGTPKPQFGAALFGGVAWVVYSSGSPGARDIFFRVSTDGGATYGSDQPLANSPGIDEYNFDIRHYSIGTGGGVDLIYFSDSAGTSADKLMWRTATVGTPIGFSPAIQVSEHSPVANTAAGYIPFLLEYYNTAADVGASWVGLDVSARRVYFDRLNAPPLGIHNSNNQIPHEYFLGQNYPNPFNPVTKIKFDVPSAEVHRNTPLRLAVYDILGREIAVLVNGELKAGSYEVDWDASNVSSEIYFYKLIAGNFVQTRKMVLLK